MNDAPRLLVYGITAIQPSVLRVRSDVHDNDPVRSRDVARPTSTTLRLRE